MDTDAPAPKRTVTLTLDEGLVVLAEQHTDDLSRTVEALLTRYVTVRRVQQPVGQEELDRTIDFVNELRARDGLLSDEFPSF